MTIYLKKKKKKKQQPGSQKVLHDIHDGTGQKWTVTMLYTLSWLQEIWIKSISMDP